MSGLVLILMGVAVTPGLCSYAENNIDEAREARLQWPTVQGAVLASSFSGDPPDVPYNVTVKFAYKVGSVRYSAKQNWREREGFLNTFLNQAPRTQEAKRWYRPGRSVRVHYAPTNPAKAVIQPTAYMPWWFRPMLGLAIFAEIASVGLGISRCCTSLWPSPTRGQ